jgi:hypothetical protein
MSRGSDIKIGGGGVSVVVANTKVKVPRQEGRESSESQ